MGVPFHVEIYLLVVKAENYFLTWILYLSLY